jgi:hypothetical protein
MGAAVLQRGRWCRTGVDSGRANAARKQGGKQGRHGTAGEMHCQYLSGDVLSVSIGIGKYPHHHISSRSRQPAAACHRGRAAPSGEAWHHSLGACWTEA